MYSIQELASHSPPSPGAPRLLDQVRHQRALELIRAGGYPVERIAAAVGYRDARSFRRAFKRWTGCNPSEFRR